jgi:hypothetical protein
MSTMPSRFTRHQVHRATLPDAETNSRIYLIKNVSLLHATYQVRLLLYKAEQTGKKLVLRIPKACKFGRDLAEMRREYAKSIVVERV